MSLPPPGFPNAPYTRHPDEIGIVRNSVSGVKELSHEDRLYQPSTSSLSSAPMIMSLSSDSSLRSHDWDHNRAALSCSLPPLRSLVSLDSHIKPESDGRRTKNALPLEGRASSSQGLPGLYLTEDTSQRSSKNSDMILKDIYQSSLDLAQCSQEAQRISSDIPEDIKRMQRLANDLDSHLRDLRDQIDVPPSLPQSYLYDPGTIAERAREAQRRRSSGNSSSSSAILEALSARRREDRKGNRSHLSNRNNAEQRRLSETIQLPKIVGHATRHSEGDIQRILKAGSNSLASSSEYPSKTYSQYSHSSYDSHETNEAASKTSPSSFSSIEESRQNKYRKRSRAPAPGICRSCGAEDTPEWRRGPQGARTLCNACGLHFSKMVRKKRNSDGGSNDDVTVSLEELQASVLPNSGLTNESEKESIIAEAAQ